MGKHEYDSQKLKSQKYLIYSAERFNAQMITAGLSSKLSKKISRLQFDWEKNQNSISGSKSNPIMYDDVVPQLEQIAEDAEDE